MMGRKKALRVLARAALNWQVSLQHALDNREDTSAEDEASNWAKKDIEEINQAFRVLDGKILGTKR